MIYEILGRGKENARTAKDIASALKTDRRTVSAVVERERREGKPICATCDSKTPGYFIPATREEMETYCGQLQHRAGEIFKTRAACLNTLAALPAADGQE